MDEAPPPYTACAALSPDPHQPQSWEEKLERAEEERIAILLKLEECDQYHHLMQYVERKWELEAELERCTASSGKEYNRLQDSLDHIVEHLATGFLLEHEHRCTLPSRWPQHRAGDMNMPRKMRKDFEEDMKRMEELTAKIASLRQLHCLPPSIPWPPSPAKHRGGLSKLVGKLGGASKVEAREQKEREEEEERLRGPKETRFRR